MPQVATVSFFRFEGLKDKFWAGGQVYHSREILNKMENVVFFKMLGNAGGKGYSLNPDFSHYTLLIVWKSEYDAVSLPYSPIYHHLMNRAKEQYTMFLRPISAKGAWSGFGGWEVSKEDPNNKLVVALTRATIKPSFLYKFWKMVPKVSRQHHKYKGLIYTKGISEVPILEQATFSVWESVEDMEDFAYRTFHNEAVFQTRKADGFKEEMFCRFQPIATLGTFKGEDPILPHLQKQSDPLLLKIHN